MKKFKKISLVLMLFASLFLTGCSIADIIQRITNISQVIQQVVPAVGDAISSIRGAFGGSRSNPRPPAVPPTSPPSTPPDQSSGSEPTVSIPTAGEGETIGQPGAAPVPPPVDQSPAQPQPPETPEAPPATPQGALEIRVDVRSGGGSMENHAYNWARGAVRPATNDPGVLRHEAVHWINSEITQKLGGNVSWQNLNPNLSRAFYLWGENKYWVVPNTSVRKIEVLPLVPTHLTRHHQNYFFNHDFGSRDALHIIEDFSAEISSGDKSTLLMDKIIFSAALGLKMEQLDRQGSNKYWTQSGGALYRGTIKAFMERAVNGMSARLQGLRTDNNPKTVALREFLIRTYGNDWTRRVLGF